MTMNGDQIREKFIRDNAEFLLDEYAKVLRGEAKFSCESNHFLGKAIDMIQKIVLDSSDTMKSITIEKGVNTTSIIEALRNGEISVHNAKELLHLTAIVQDINELPKLIEKMEQIGGIGSES